MSGQYFEVPTGTERRRTVRCTIWGRDYTFSTANGVFSADGLDLGTAVLLRETEPPRGRLRILDLGCGWGPIACALATEAPQAWVDAVDVNPRAVALCRANAEALGVGERVRALTVDEVAAGQAYDQIWSNPPIRIGKEALHELLTRWLARLNPGGVAQLVVGKNLGADSLHRWLEEQGHGCTRVASAKGFRVLRVEQRCAS